jgi:hypothetical protein
MNAKYIPLSDEQSYCNKPKGLSANEFTIIAPVLFHFFWH